VTLNIHDKPYGFAASEKVLLVKEIATPVRFEWDAPVQDNAGNPLNEPVSNYELWVNGFIYTSSAPSCTVADDGGLQVAKVRASCDGQTWSDWSDICAKDFPLFSISGNGVWWKAEPPLSYSLLWTSSLFESWQTVYAAAGDGQTKTWPLIGGRGFFKLEGKL
jgi:hypothetical protein